VIGLVAFLVGVTFALGLGVGGMTQPTRVLAFLDVAGDWDPSLAFVMAGAVGVYAVVFRIARRRGRPILAPAFSLPTRTGVDASLIGGALVFGIGWGLAGLCPGPALTSLATATPSAVFFVVAMLVGIGMHKLLAAVIGPPITERMAAYPPWLLRFFDEVEQNAAKSEEGFPP
jgi:uncharacterized membrane protein YedE/YeeE